MEFPIHTLVGFVARLHPAVVHFPIASLALAALIEGIQVWRRSLIPSTATPLLSMAAALGGMVSSGLGLLLKQYKGTEGSLVSLHGWVGLGATLMALVAIVSFTRGAARPWAVRCGRLALAAGTILVLGAGYLGGEMVLGPNHLFEVFKPKPFVLPLGSEVDFERQIAPILRTSCLKCHGSGTRRGHLCLDRKEDAFRGGEDGPAIVPEDRARSLLFLLIKDRDPAYRMPQDADPLTPTQIELIGRWIDAGARWPEGMVLH